MQLINMYGICYYGVSINMFTRGELNLGSEPTDFILRRHLQPTEADKTTKFIHVSSYSHVSRLLVRGNKRISHTLI